MQQSSSSSIERVIGTTRLDWATFEDAEHDTDGSWQAAIVGAMLAILIEVGSLASRTQNLFDEVLVSVVILVVNVKVLGIGIAAIDSLTWHPG